MYYAFDDMQNFYYREYIHDSAGFNHFDGETGPVNRLSLMLSTSLGDRASSTMVRSVIKKRLSKEFFPDTAINFRACKVSIDEL